jgi:hypothetical protein
MVTEFHPVLARRNGDALESLVAALNRYLNFVDCGIPTGEELLGKSEESSRRGTYNKGASFRLPGS